MGFLIGTVLVIFVLASLLLIFLVMIQSGKGGNMGIMGGGGASQSVFGSSSTDVMTKATRYFAVGFMVLSLLLSFLFAKKQEAILPESTLQPDSSNPPALVPNTDSTKPAETNQTAPATTVPANSPDKKPETQQPK